MTQLSPSEASRVAAAVYALRESGVSDAIKAMKKSERGALSLDGLFQVGEESRFEGSSGMLYRPLSGFGYIAAGQGRFQGDVLVVTRGTASTPDWLTNINVAAQTGPSGHLVHGGFNQTWKSFSQEVRAFLRGRNPTTIHCVGHSLGGALATLNADFFSQAKVGKVIAYTFGAPRVGMHWFAKSLTQRVRSDNVLRLAHPSDPVPMIPLFPYCHAPSNTPGLTVPAGGSGISVAAHSIKSSYQRICADKDWSAFKAAASAPPERDSAIQSWLENPASLSGLRTMSSELLALTARALRWLLKKAGQLAAAALGTGLTVGATLIDQFAWLLHQGASLSARFGRWVTALIRAIFKFLGRTVTTGMDLTQAFLRWVLGMLFQTLSSLAGRALSLVGG